MKTSELTGAALDWAVAKCDGVRINPLTREGQRFMRLHSYSTNWAQGGPIIEREKVCVAWLSKQDLGIEPEHYCAAHIDGIYCRYGQTPLIAAMRCYVASKLGDEVNIPEELK
jgi:hypothetical protein